MRDLDKLKKLLTEIENGTSLLDSNKIIELVNLTKKIDDNITDEELRNNIHDNAAAVIFNSSIIYVNSLHGKSLNQLKSELEQVLLFLNISYAIASSNELKQNIKKNGEEIAKAIGSEFNPKITGINSKRKYFSYLSNPIVMLIILGAICGLILSLINNQTSPESILKGAGFGAVFAFCIVYPILYVALWIISFISSIISSITKPPF